MRFQHEIQIEAPVHEVYTELLDMIRWPETIPHVTKIEPIEYNNKIQHVNMSVLSNNGIEKMETVRTFKKDKWIKFHQISMPPVLKRHDGVWKFISKGKYTIVRSIHMIDTNYPIVGGLAAYIAWKFYISRNSAMTLRAVKLKLEYNKHDNRIVKGSCFIKHSIDVNIPIEDTFKAIGDPALWPELYPTAISSEIIQDNGELCEFKLVEYVGEKKFYSHSFLHRDIKNKKIYYQHYPPSFPLKYMVIRWKFEALDDEHTRFTILREYDVKIPIIGKLIANTYGKKVIRSHVDDYYKDLRNYETKYLLRKGQTDKCQTEE